MEQAKNFLLLSKVDAHIVASMTTTGCVTKFTARHFNGEEPNRIQINLEKVRGGVTISYDAIYEGDRVSQEPSSPVPEYLLIDFLSQIANDTIPKQRA